MATNPAHTDQNLYDETLEIMTGYHPCDVTFIGIPDDDYACTWDAFSKMANNVIVNVHPYLTLSDLEIHFKDGGRLIRQVDSSGYDRGWKRLYPIIKNMVNGEFRKLTTLCNDELSKEKKELLELQRLKKKYETS